MTVHRSLIDGNTATSEGGGIRNYGTLTLINSTVGGNSAEDGGGITTFNANVTLINSTVAENSASDIGGGIQHTSAQVQLDIRSSIVADNSPIDCAGVAASSSRGYNLDSDTSCRFTNTGDLSGVDPLLGALADNGGPTPTYALLPGSPAIDAADPASTLNEDQRGELRPVDGDGNGVARADIGAFEEQDVPPTGLTANGNLGSVTLDWDDSTDPDFASYNVYRATVSGGPFTQIASGLSASAYVDTAVINGQTYYYYVTAIDTSSNESSTSVAASATTTHTGPRLETVKVENVGSSGWITVDLGLTYTSMVVVCSPNYDTVSPPGVVRIRDASGSSFEVSMGEAGGGALSGVNVYCMVVEEGVYTEGVDGVVMEATKYQSTVTDQNDSWSGEPRGYSNTYVDPVVLGQVMTYNDERWSVFWSSRTGDRFQPPTAASLSTGKHVGEDPVAVRLDETIGQIVIESGSGVIGDTEYVAALGPDTVTGVQSGPPVIYSIDGPNNAAIAVVTMAAMDGFHGGWAVLQGQDPVSGTALRLLADEDQAGDPERFHTSEQVGYIVLGRSNSEEYSPAVTRRVPDADTIVMEEGEQIIAKAFFSDPDGDLQRVDWYLDDVLWKTGAASGYSTKAVKGLWPLGPGTYKLRAAATDAGGYSSSNTWTVTVEGGAPTLSRRVPSSDTFAVTEGDRAMVKAFFADPNGDLLRVDWYLDDVLWKTGAASGSWTKAVKGLWSLTGGTYQVRAVVTDEGGSTASNTWIVTVKGTGPTLDRRVPDSASIRMTAGELTIAKAFFGDPNGDLKRVDWLLDGVLWKTRVASGSWTKAVKGLWTLAVGTYELQVVATDAEGSTSTNTWTVNVDPYPSYAPSFACRVKP